MQVNITIYSGKRQGAFIREGVFIRIYLIYSRLSLSRNRRDPQKHFEISVLRHIRFVVLRKKQFEQPNFINDYVIGLLKLEI